MNRRTFEVISKYISSQNGNAKIVFDQQHDGACCNMEDNTIHMPDKIGDKNVFAALALIMHESAHIAYSKEAFEKCVDKTDPVSAHIFNVIEDVRIDRRNFYKLSNIQSFYERLIKDHCHYAGQKKPEVEFTTKICINAIFRCEGFQQYGFDDDPAVDEFLDDNPMENLIYQGGQQIDARDWKGVKQTIEDIRKLLNKANQQNQQKQNKKSANGQDQGQELDKVEGLLHPAKAFSDSGTALKGASAGAIGELALEEQTVNQFKELLNIKERKIVDDGTILDTDNLTAFLTGEIDELFKDDAYIKRKKSKILLLLDASGSMRNNLLDGKRAYKIVSKCCNRLARILKEVQEMEGINVDWEVAKFECSGMELMDKDNWQSMYRAVGGTNLELAFSQAVDYLQKDYTIDGKRMIIVMTDGEVGDSQIQGMKKTIIRMGTDIKALIIGIGTDPTGPMALEILGDNLILAEENANEVLLETIRSML